MTGHEIVQRRDALKATRTALEGHWDELSTLYMPFRLAAGDIPDIPSSDKVFDTSPRQAALILANGLASLVTPREEMWFEFQPPRSLRKDDEAVRFYRQASETAREFIESSNFYEEIQESYIESPVFGTAALFCGDLDDRGELFFSHQAIKTYYITEDAKKRVNGFFRELNLTANQAAEEFGEENLPQEVQQKLKQPLASTEQFQFLHAVMRRQAAAEDDVPEGQKKPWQSFVVHEKSKKVVQEGGYDEFPFAVHRFRRFSRCVWGFGPGTYVAGSCRQLQVLNELADVATEKSVFPPIIAPSSLEGEIGQGALEITYVDPSDPNSAAMLREWATAGRYDVAKDRMHDKRDQVEQAFYVDLFQLFASRAMQRAPMTATEASLIAGEKLTQFSPIFGRLVSELLDPVLARVFGVLLRAGQFGPPPPSVMRMVNGKQMGIASPSMLYKNRIMLAMQARENGSLMEFMGMVQPMIQLYPDAVDALDMPTIVRESARNGGLPESWIRSQKAINEIQAARAEQRAQQQQAAQMESAANVVQKVGNAPADVRQNLGQMMQQA